MNNTPIRNMDLQSLSLLMINLSSAVCENFAEAAAVCLEDRRHLSGAMLCLGGHFTCNYSLSWMVSTPQIRATHDDLQDATEFGAHAIAFLVALDQTEYTVIKRARKLTGVDWWMGHKEDELLQHAARLEVTGILDGDDSQIDRRVGLKRKQVRQSDATHLPAFICVVEFGKPCCRLMKSA